MVRAHRRSRSHSGPYRSSRWPFTASLVAALLGVSAPPPALGAQEGTPAGALAELGFMAGCWFGGTTTLIEERYTPPSANVMLGTTRYMREGRTVQFELTTIVADDAGVTLLPYPGGRASEHGFRLTSAGGGKAVFEAPEHDYPKRIVYRLVDGRLVARIDGGADDPEPRRWIMEPVDCGRVGSFSGE